MSTTFNTIWNDLKTSLKFASGNILSYLLAFLGMAIVIALLFAAVALPVAIIAFASIAASGIPWTDFGVGLGEWAIANPLAVGGAGMLFLIPVVSLFFMVIGSIYGMSRQLVVTGETKAELAFSYFKNKFLSFFGAGFLLTLIIVVPQAAVWILVGAGSGWTVAPVVSTGLSIFGFVYTFITVGFCAMVLPAVVSGKGVIDAFKESFNMAINRFDRVFGLLSAVFVLLGATFGPMMIAAFVFSSNPTVGPALVGFAAAGLWTVIMVFLWAILFLPMTIIAFNKVYVELTGGEVYQQAPPEIPIV